MIRTRILMLTGTTLLLLAGCDKPVTRSEVQDIAEDSAPDTSALESRIAVLEAEVKRLGSEQSKDISMLADITRADANDTRSVNAELKRLSDNDNAFLAQINYLRELQGRPPMPVKR